MRLVQIITSVIILIITLICLDAAWFIASLDSFYKPLMGELLNPSPNLLAGGIFYIIYAIGLQTFVVQPSFKEKPYKQTIWRASLFGLVAFSTYDLTALSVIQGFSIKLAIGDILWGVFAATLSCMVTIYTLRRLFKMHV